MTLYDLREQVKYRMKNYREEPCNVNFQKLVLAFIEYSLQEE